jgi:hypothetical protein
LESIRMIVDKKRFRCACANDGQKLCSRSGHRTYEIGMRCSALELALLYLDSTSKPRRGLRASLHCYHPLRV